MSIATAEQTVVDRSRRSSSSEGSGATPRGGDTLAVIDPSTEEAICEVADGTPDDAMAALDAAVATQPELAAMPPNDRAGISGRPSS